MNTTPTPLFEKLVSWMGDAANVHDQQNMYMYSSITLISTLMGRTWRFQGSIPNIYTILLAGTSSGKEIAKQGINVGVTACGLEDRLGASDFASGAGIASELNASNLRTFILDEAPALVRAISDPENTPAYLANVPKLLLEVFSGSSIRGRALKEGAESNAITEPFPNLFMLAQPSEFWKACGGAKSSLVHNGLFGRCLFAEGVRLPRLKRSRGVLSEPGFLVEHYQRSLRKSEGSILGKITGCGEHNEMSSTAEADAWLDVFLQGLNDRRDTYREDQTSIRGEIECRDMEKIKKLAMIHAWSQDPENPIVTVEGLSWGESVVKSSTLIFETAASRTPRSVFEAQVEEVLAYLDGQAKNPANRTKRAILANLVHLGPTLKKAIDHCIEGGLIVSTGEDPMRTFSRGK